MRTTLLQALSLLGTAITTSYTPGASFGAGRASKVSVEGVITTTSSTAMTSVQMKLQASADGSTWNDVETLSSLVASGGTPTVDQSINTTSSATFTLAFQIPQGFSFVRIAAKATGGAGKAGESIVGALTLQ